MMLKGKGGGNIFTLFPISVGGLPGSHHEADVSCRFSRDILYQFEEVPLFLVS